MKENASSAIVFAYHNVGVRCLSVLLAQGIDVKCVITHRDSPTETIWFDSVAELAGLHGIPVITPDDANDPDVVKELAALEPDFLFSFYYRQMLQAPLLELPKRGAYNMHGSLLPKYRGRVPVNWAVLRGETETGATLHEMVIKPDAGGIVAQQAVPILPDDTAHTVFNKVTLAAEMALHGALPDLLAGRALALEQNLAAGSYFGGRKAEDGRIDWNQTAVQIHNLVRAVAPPYPGAFFEVAGKTLKILRSLHPDGTRGQFGRPTLFVAHQQLLAECGDGQQLRILALEFDGRLIDADQFPSVFGTTALSLT
jgi:methionyl-tRNA formyltransferase